MILDIDPRFVPMNLPYNQEHWNMISTILMLKENYTPGKLALCYNTFLNRFFNNSRFPIIIIYFVYTFK